MKQSVRDSGGVPSGETMRDLRREVTRMQPLGDQYDVTTRGAGLRAVRMFGARRRFSGTVYLSGVKHTGKNSDPSKPYVVIDKAANTVTESAGPEPEPFPAHQEWYLKANTYGDIHETGF